MTNNFSYVAAWQWNGEGQAPDSSQGAADIRVCPLDAAELQVIMNITLKIWRQKNAETAGQFVTYVVKGVTADMSFLEMLDVLNEELIGRGEEPVAFDHDCREGICGSCGFLIDGVAHGPRRGTTVCQLHMRFFKDGDSLTLEPWRAKAFPVVKDLVVDRSAFDRIIQSGGFISAATGQRPGRQCRPGPQGGRRHGDGRRRVHRLRCLRGRLPERVGHAVHRRPRSRT